MAAIGATLQTAALPSAGVQPSISQSRTHFLNGTPAAFVKIGKVVKNASRRASVVCSAEGAELRTQEAAAAETSAPFANVSATVSTPQSSPAPPSAPIVVGAGLVAASAIAFLANKLSGTSTPSVPSPIKLVEKAEQTLASSGFLPPRAVKEAAPAALKSLATNFPNAMEDREFIRACAKELFGLGFSKDNCIALVNTCRDEVCRPLVMFVDQEFGLSFNISGLGGLINCGKTGFRAGMSHSPEFPCDSTGKPRERYVFFAFPHVSVGETGEVGSLLRRGRGKPSNACGALIAIQSFIKSGDSVSEDPDDPELVLLKKKIVASNTCKTSSATGPDLVTVTKAALEVITNDLEQIISQVVNPATADYAVVTGVQVHSGNQVPGEPFRVDRTIDYIAPGTMYAVIQGKRYEMTVTSDKTLKVIQSLNA